MKRKPTTVGAALALLGVGSLLALTGCSQGEGAKTATDIDAFRGNPNSPEAKASAQSAMAEDAQKAAAARSAAQGQTAPKK